MQTADFDYKDFENSAQRDQDKGLLVKFYIKPLEQKGKSKEAGRPIFVDTEYIDIKIPGNRGAGAVRKATPADKQRFPEHYAAFKQRTDDDQDEGLPLTEWPGVTRSQAEEMAFFHIKTVEQLANMADGQAGKFMGMYQLREKAKAFLEHAKSTFAAWELEQKFEEMRKENADLRESLNGLMEQVANSQAAPKPTKTKTRRAKKKLDDIDAGEPQTEG